jgi:hypothetical protein
MKITQSEILFHPDACKDFLIRFLIENPKTKIDSVKLKNEFESKFPNDELLYELPRLYTLGIVSRHAMYEFYICETILDIIKSCIKAKNTPTWD